MHTPINKSKTGYEEYQRVRTVLNKVLADKQLPNTVNGVSGIVDRELTWLAGLDYNWECQLVKHSLAGNGVIHRKLKCRGVWPKEFPSILLRHQKSISGLTVNIVDADLDANPKLKLQPAIAANNQQYNYRQPLIKIARDLTARGTKVLAGINGGYFFIPPNSIRTPFLDSNCLSNFYLNFEKKPYTSQQIGDGLLVIEQQPYSYNCSTIGPFSPARTSFIQKGNNYLIEPVAPGKINTQGITNALGAGPGLISAGQIAIRSELIPSTLEFAANTALILGKTPDGHHHAVLFTVDGKDDKFGMYSFEMANFIAHKLKDITHVTPSEAMSMDQGGSTGMVVSEFDKLRTVSNSGEKDRPVYNALFIVE